MSAEPTPGLVPGVPPRPTEEVRSALAVGDLDLQGRIMPASNATFFGEAVCEEVRVACVYKPVAGERPLWDFPSRTLANRERAAYLVSEALGWDVVPLTILRDGPHGRGMVQLWCEPEDAGDGLDAVDLCPGETIPEGYLHVLDATDGSGQDVALVHEDSRPLRRMAVFDAVVNNADRKGGHVLAMTGGHRHGVDHGVCFHVEDKLRTLLWGWAGEPLPDTAREALTSLATDLAGPLGVRLAELITPDEVAATRERVRVLLAENRLPQPDGRRHVIPWPPI